MVLPVFHRDACVLFLTHDLENLTPLGLGQSYLKIGMDFRGKADGVAELLSFDLMKSDWETKIPQSQAIELNMDIVMSSSPIHQCSETLLNLLQLEKVFLVKPNSQGAQRS